MEQSNEQIFMQREQERLHSQFPKAQSYISQFPATKTWKPHDRAIEDFFKPDRAIEAVVTFKQLEHDTAPFTPCTFDEFIKANNIPV